MKSRNVLGATIFLAAAFGMISSAIAQTPEIDLRQGWEKYPSNYEVPAPDELKHLATFPMEGVRLRDRNSGETEFRYSLPQELTGRPVEIRLFGTLDANGNGKMKGEFSEASCLAADCTVNYPRLKIEPADVKQFLVTRGVQGLELEQRLKVAHLFRSGDPAGIIHIKSYGRN